MEKLDISILEKIPELTKKFILEIKPLAPLSMVSELPGSYYKTLKSPDKKMLCGLFENILGWHIDLKDRKTIIKDLDKQRKKHSKTKVNTGFDDRTKGSTYSPLLIDYFDIIVPVVPVIEFYDDLWNKAYRRSDADVHPKGTFNMDFEKIPAKRKLPRDKEKPQKIDNSSLLDFFKKNITFYPLYYSTPSKREYLYTKGIYQIELMMDMDLYKMLKTRLKTNNIGFLGNSEGWIDLNIKEL